MCPLATTLGRLNDARLGVGLTEGERHTAVERLPTDVAASIR